MKIPKIALCAAVLALSGRGLFAAPAPQQLVPFMPVTLALTVTTEEDVPYPDMADLIADGVPASYKVTVKKKNADKHPILWTETEASKVVTTKLGNKEILALLVEEGIIPETQGWVLVYTDSLCALKKVDKTHYQIADVSSALQLNMLPGVLSNGSAVATYTGVIANDPGQSQIDSVESISTVKQKGLVSIESSALLMRLKGLLIISAKMKRGENGISASFTSGKMSSIIGVVGDGVATGKASFGKAGQLDPNNIETVTPSQP